MCEFSRLALFLHPPSKIKVTLVVCLTFALRRFVLCISLQRNSCCFFYSIPEIFSFSQIANQTLSNFLSSY